MAWVRACLLFPHAVPTSAGLLFLRASEGGRDVGASLGRAEIRPLSTSAAPGSAYIGVRGPPEVDATLLFPEIQTLIILLRTVLGESRKNWAQN